jgi:primosomal protein N' (replication factor Y)
MSNIQKFQTNKYHGQVLKIAIPTPLRRLFDYLPADEDIDENHSKQSKLKPGIRVLVSFGRRSVVGVLVAIATGSALEQRQLKKITQILDESPLFPSPLLKTLLWSAAYYQHPIGEVLSTALPSNLRSGDPLNETFHWWKIAKSVSAEAMSALTCAPKQNALYRLLASNDKENTKTTIEVIKKAGFTKPLLNELTKKGFAEEIIETTASAEAFAAIDPVAFNKISLNKEQSTAVEAIKKKRGSYSSFLLDGVTGSGKTEVYMRVMQEQLARGKQCLVMVPEIGLTPQTIARFEERFPCPVVALHSGLNNKERLRAWRAAKEGRAGIVIGTRSAIFTPLAKPGLIVIDEEHDPSFKQQEGFRYSARDLATVRGREEKLLIILGTATPSLESLYNVRTKKYQHLKLNQRAGSSKPAKMELVDVADGHLDNGFSSQLLFRIGKHLQEGNQVLVFINRRGFAPILNCQACGWISECENCIAQLTVHAKPPSMRCHHCGIVKLLPKYCPHCKSTNLSTLGMGTQKIESFLSKKYSQHKVIRIDRDSTRSKKRLSQLLDEVQKGDPCILLGTQMLAKGHHFPNITLVAIVDADAGLFSADFRGQEQMAQTIVQVAGRSGRADREGEVLIQSRHSDHSTLQRLTQKSYGEFTEALFKEREQTFMPPFAHLCLIRAEGKEFKTSLAFLQQVAALTEQLCKQHKFSIELLGPLPAPMEKRAGRFRLQLLLKSGKRTDLQNLLSILAPLMETVKVTSSIRWSIDIDPSELI